MGTEPTTAPAPARRSRAWIWVTLLLISALAFGLRFGAITRLLPVRPEPDLDMVMMYRSMAGEEIPNAEFYLGRYPVLWPRVLATVSGSSLKKTPPPSAPLEQHLAAASTPFLNTRVLMAAISFLTAPLAFFLTRRWIGEAWALLAAAFCATALMHVAHSSVCKAHAAHVSLAWFTIWLALRQQGAPSLPRILATSVSAVVTIGTFHTGFFVLLPMVAAALLARPNSRLLSWSAWIAVPISFLGGLLFTPGGLGLVSDVQMGPRIHSAGFKLGTGHALLLSSMNGSGLLKWPLYLWEHDPLLTILAGVGLLVMLGSIKSAWRDSRLRCESLLVGAYVLPYMVVISLDSNVVDRYLLPLYPFFALLAALAARKAFGALPGTPVKVLACLALLAFPTYLAARYTWIGRRASTFDLLANWIEAQPEAASKKILLSPGITPPLPATAAALKKQLAYISGRWQPWFAYLGRLERLPETKLAYDLEPLAPEFYVEPAKATPEALAAWFELERPDWIVLEVAKRILREPGTTAVYTFVRQNADLVATFAGEDSDWAGKSPLEYQGVRDLATRIMKASAFGPQLELYRWRGR